MRLMAGVARCLFLCVVLLVLPAIVASQPPPPPPPPPSPFPDLSCTELFGSAPDFVLCEETETTCSFNARIAGGTCDQMCASLGSTCVGAINNGESCEELPDNNDTCETSRSTEICICERPEETTTPPPPPDTDPPPPPDTVADEFTVSSTAGWQRTPFTLRQFEQFTVSYVSGEWTVDHRNFPYVGLEGYTEDIDSQIYQGCKYIADWPYGMLIGKVGENGELLRLDHGSPTPLQDGTLFLRIHDNDGCLADNDGSLTVRVTPVAGNPNLQSTEITFDTSTAVVGGTVFFDSGVSNIGDVDTGVFNIQWLVNGQDVGAAGSHAGVPAGQTVLDGNSQFSWTFDSPGTYSVSFTVDFDNQIEESNEEDNSTTIDVVVTSQPPPPGQPPEITLLGADPLQHTAGCPFVGAGATATDTEDGDLTDSIIITGTENLDSPGLYTITYSVTDSSRLSDSKSKQVAVSGAIGTTACFVGIPAGKAPYLVVLVHGCCTDANDVKNDWESLGETIAGAIQTPAPEQWEVVVWDWSKDTTEPYPGPAYDKTEGQSLNLSLAIAKHTYKYIHFIGHSAGSRLIDLTAKRLVNYYKTKEEKPFIHLTFLDAYQPNNDDYGKLEGYSYHYSEHYVNRGGLPSDWPLTDPCLKDAFNFDITDWENNDKDPNDRNSGHFWPFRWYKQSIATTSGFKFGYPLSFGGGVQTFISLFIDYPNHRQCHLTDKDTTCETGDKAPSCW